MKVKVQSSGNLPNGEIKHKERLITKIMTHNYEENLSAEIITQNYELVYYVAQKCVSYRDTGVSKKINILQCLR